MSQLDDIRALELEIHELGQKLHQMRRETPRETVPDYPLQTMEGTTSLRELFGEREKLLVIHNMGQGCRYCTLWADGINAFLPHLESTLAVVLVSGDDPLVQRRLGNDRGWRFRMASHGGGDYIRQQSTQPGQDNTPGAVCYGLQDDKIMRLGSSSFGPGDPYCAMWPLLSLAGIGLAEWTPQFNYWRRPDQMNDGGENLID
jgi:predicted dithiol-disulfide oxidoreductase (DUF899 family)